MVGEKRETEEVRERPLTTLFLSLLFFSDEGVSEQGWILERLREGGRERVGPTFGGCWTV